MKYFCSIALFLLSLCDVSVPSPNERHLSLKKYHSGSVKDLNVSSDSKNADDENAVPQLPHIVMIVLDDLGSHDLGLHGTGIHTPNIDGFVASTTGIDGNGIYLDDYYVLPYCSPTRSALLSGMYPLRTGVHNVIGEISTAGLPLDVETLPEMLKRAVSVPTTNADEKFPQEEKNGQDSSSSSSSSSPIIADGSDVAVNHHQQHHPYQTHAVGKWHVGHSSWEQTPTFRGFDSFFGFYQGGQDYFTHSSRGGVDLHFDRSPNCGKGCSEVVDERGNYSTHVFTREAIKVVENHANKFGGKNNNNITSSGVASPSPPLFLYLAYQAVHCPNEVPPEYMVPYENRTDWTEQRINYAGMLTVADEGIGNLTQALKDNGLWENTLIVFTTDNGGPTTVGCTQGSSNYPKRGGKCSLWEGGTTGDALLAGPALPGLLSHSSRAVAPKTLPSLTEKSRASVGTPFTRFQHLFHVVDWFPTLAEWVGVVPLNQTVLDGVSQVKSLSNSKIPPARTELFGGYAYWPDDDSGTWWGPSIRHLNWKLVQGMSGGPDAENPMPPGTTDIVPPGDNSTINDNHANDANKNNNEDDGADGGYLLFDLAKDPREETDLSKVYPEILQNMVKRLKLYRKSFVYPQANDDSKCPFPGLVNTTNVGPAWFPWCDDLEEPELAIE